MYTMRQLFKEQLIELAAKMVATQDESEKDSLTQYKVEKFLSFTEQELNNMPETLKVEFRDKGRAPRVIKRIRSEASDYVFCYQKNGFDFSVTSEDYNTGRKLLLNILTGYKPQSEEAT